MRHQWEITAKLLQHNMHCECVCMYGLCYIIAMKSEMNNAWDIFISFFANSKISHLMLRFVYARLNITKRYTIFFITAPLKKQYSKVLHAYLLHCLTVTNCFSFLFVLFFRSFSLYLFASRSTFYGVCDYTMTISTIYWYATHARVFFCFYHTIYFFRRGIYTYFFSVVVVVFFFWLFMKNL